MKQVFFFSVLCFLFSQAAFAQTGNTNMDGGRTYYDAGKTRPKEVFMYKEVFVFNPDDPNASEAKTQKHGPYFHYYENGKLKISGNYKNDQKDGEWKHYNETGKLIKIETYVNGELQQE